MKLSRILAVKSPGGVLGRPGEPTFVLETRSGTRIVWGYAPGALNTPGEMPAADKVARLRHYLDTYDTFDSPQGQRQVLDLRTMPSPLRP